MRRRLPGRGDVSRFIAAMRGPARRSALRGMIDGFFVSWTLERRGARPLLVRTGGGSARLDPEHARRVTEAVDAGMGMIPFAPTCLRRSLTLARELDRVGLAATVHIGVRSVTGTIEAHAWVQAGDVVVNDEPALIQSYAELAAGDLDTVLPLLR